MSHTFFASELEGVATFWRILRKDGAVLGFTSHNRPLTFDNIVHLAAPGILPSAIRRTAQLDRDSVEVQGVLSHDSISAGDLERGRFTDARVVIGLVDWESLDRAPLFQGKLGNVSAEDGGFVAELRSAKTSLEQDLVPRTSPTCRATFCDARCQLNPAHYTHIVTLESFDLENNSLVLDRPIGPQHLQGQMRWIDGPDAGLAVRVVDIIGNALVIDQPLSQELASGHRAYLREGCDHTIGTCSARFENARNFRGEPFLPGNDLLTRYPTSST